jgi:hypothetical protein
MQEGIYGHETEGETRTGNGIDRGLGEAIAKLLAAEGVAVVVNGGMRVGPLL